MAQNRATALQVVDPVLTQVARLYRPEGFIYDQLVADIPVQTLTGLFPVFTEDYWFGFGNLENDTLVKDRAPAKEVDFEWSTESYVVREHALKVSITDLERQQAHPSLRLERNKTLFLERLMVLAREIRLAARLLSTDDGGDLTAARDSTPSVNWDQATATIEADVKVGVLDVYDTIGMLPNTIVIPYKVAYAMAVQEDIRDVLKWQSSGSQADFIQLGSRVLPGTIHGMRVVIPQGAQRNTAAEGATKSISEIWGDEVRLLYVDANAEWGTPSVIYRIQHTARTVTRFSTVEPDVDYVREKERYQDKVVAPDAGHILRNVLS